MYCKNEIFLWMRSVLGYILVSFVWINFLMNTILFCGLFTCSLPFGHMDLDLYFYKIIAKNEICVWIIGPFSAICQCMESSEGKISWTMCFSVQ